MFGKIKYQKKKLITENIQNKQMIRVQYVPIKVWKCKAVERLKWK